MSKKCYNIQMLNWCKNGTRNYEIRYSDFTEGDVLTISNDDPECPSVDFYIDKKGKFTVVTLGNPFKVNKFEPLISAQFFINSIIPSTDRWAV